MENHVVVSICGEEYNFVAQEAPSYMQRVGSYVEDVYKRQGGHHATVRQWDGHHGASIGCPPKPGRQGVGYVSGI